MTTNTDQAARLARKAQTANRRALAAATATATPPVYMHTAMPPYVTTEPQHSDQRYFTHGKDSPRPMTIGSSPPGEFFCLAEVQVLRFADFDLAQLSIEITSGYNSTSTSIKCTAQELREIAARLLDAAHDLDVNPANMMTRREA